MAKRPPSKTPDAFTAGVPDDDHEEDLEAVAGEGSPTAAATTPDPYVDPVPPPDLGEPTVVIPPELLADEPDLPGFAMGDDPIPPPAAGRLDTDRQPTSPSAPYPVPPNAGGGVPEGGASPYAHGQHSPSPLTPNHRVGSPEQPSYTDTINNLAKATASAGSRPPDIGLTGDILEPYHPAGSVTYESRIRILDAWQYTGQVADAPAWVDRNWIGWADHDPVRKMDASPCLRVPMGPHPNDPVVICRPGDYVVVQSTVFDDGVTTHDQIEVWEREQFQRLFLVKSNPTPTPETLDAVRASA